MAARILFHRRMPPHCRANQSGHWSIWRSSVRFGDLLLSLRGSRLVQPLSKATFFKKSLFKLPQLLIQKVIRLMNQADYGVRGDLGWSIFDIGPIGQIRPILFISEPADNLRRGMVFSPQRQTSLPQKILIVQKQFLEAGTRNPRTSGALARPLGRART